MAHDGESIKLDQFLKWQGIADSGAQAKHLVLGEQVKVNGEIELRRGRKLRAGDEVQVGDKRLTVSAEMLAGTPSDESTAPEEEG